MDIYDVFPSIIASAKSPCTVLEIGVGQGDDTHRMVNWIIGTGKPYRYFAFEPEQKNIASIREKVGDKVTLLSAGIGDRDGEMPFTGSGSWPLSGSFKEPVEHKKSYPWIPWQSPVMIPMMRLDTFALIHGIDHVDFIFADVQGGEDALIAGGVETLKRTHWLYTEFYETQEYAGQIGLSEIFKRLPGKWEIVEKWDGDIATCPGSGNVLLENKSFA